MTAFDEVRFPTGISYGSTGGPRRRTEIATLGSGAEERNSVWADSRRDYNAGYGVKSHNDLHAVVAFFEARLGQGRGFRFKDWVDYKSCAPQDSVTPLDQVIDGSSGIFQLVKRYVSGAITYTRTITKPVAGTVRVAVDGTEQTITTDFTVDTATGILYFTSEPGIGAVVTAGFEFDVPVRFNADYLNINLSAFEAGEIPDIPIIELKV